jgi:hypothetical protein
MVHCLSLYTDACSVSAVRSVRLKGSRGASSLCVLGLLCEIEESWESINVLWLRVVLIGWQGYGPALWLPSLVGEQPMLGCGSDGFAITPMVIVKAATVMEQ